MFEQPGIFHYLFFLWVHFFALVDIIAFEGELVLPHFWNSMMHSQLDTDLCLKIDVVKKVLGWT